MPWVRFTENFDWQPVNARWMISYKKNSTRLVKQVVAETAIKEGKAEPTERPINPVRLDNASR